MKKDGQEPPSLSARLEAKQKELNTQLSDESQTLSAHSSHMTRSLTSLQGEVSVTCEAIRQQMEQTSRAAVELNMQTNRQILDAHKRWPLWSGLTVMGIILIGAVTLLLSGFWMKRNLDLKREELARVMVTLQDRQQEIEEAKVRLGELSQQVNQMTFSKSVLERLKMSVAYGQSESGTEVYLKEGWRVSGCRLLNGSRPRYCIRRR